MKPKIIITIRKGILETVYCNQNIDYVLIDHDSSNDDDRIIREYEQDAIFNDGAAHEIYTDEADCKEMKIKQELKEIHF